MKKPLALLAIVASALTLAGCANSSPIKSNSTSRNVVAIGDSLTAASNSCGKDLACYKNSWATGENEAVASIARRLNTKAKKPYGVENYAVLGTKIDGLKDQLVKAIEVKPAYLTLLIGGNDFCADTTQGMTSVDHFADSFSQLTNFVREESPGTELILASTPNPQVVYEAGRNNPSARKAWLSGSICQSMLADPLDESAAAVDRRQQVVSRAIAFNRVLEENCLENCTFDGDAVEKLNLAPEDISKIDYFHMSISGQSKIAEAVWDAVSSKIK